MADEDETTTDDTATDTAADDAAEGGDGDGLGDKGREALKKERDARKAAAKEARELKAKLAELEAKQAAGAEQDQAKQAVEQARREAEAAVIAKANDRVLGSKVKELATGKLANPELAAKLLDLSEFEVGDDFGTDDEAITEAISDLIKKYPGLAAKAAGFQGSGDGGARGNGSQKRQVTAVELKTMTPAQIVAAQKEGRLANLLTGG